ncbi:MAG: hypothetical protein QM770_05275 [Tepidisphaeraceae bacterium]
MSKRSVRPLVIAFAAATLALTGTARTSQAIPTGKEWELTLLGAGTSANDFDSGGFQFSADVRYNFTDQWALGVMQSFGYSDFGDSSWSGGTRIAGYYNFNYEPDQRVVPFVGLELGYLYGDATNDTFAAGPIAGLKWYVNDTTFLFGSVTYEFLFDNTSDIDSNTDDGQFVYGLGVGFNF